MLCHIAFDEVCVHQELALFLGTILTSNNYCCHVLLPLTCNALHGMCLLIKIVVELLVSHHLMCPMLLEKVLTCLFPAITMQATSIFNHLLICWTHSHYNIVMLSNVLVSVWIQSNI